MKFEGNERSMTSPVLLPRILMLAVILANLQNPGLAQEEAGTAVAPLKAAKTSDLKVTERSSAKSAAKTVVRSEAKPADGYVEDKADKSEKAEKIEKKEKSDKTEAASEASDANIDTKADASAVPPNINSQLRTASQLMVGGKYPEAVEVFKQVIAVAPNNVDALAGMGMALGRQQKLDDADTQFNRVLELDANNPVAHCGKAMTLLSRLQSTNESDKKQRKTYLKEAGRECNKALDADPRVVEAHYLLGKVYKEEGRLDRAEQAFAGACKLDPKYANAWAYLGLVQVLQAKYAPGEESLRKAIAISANNSTAYFGLGEMYAKQGQFDKAVREYGMAIYKNPNNDAIHIAYGQAEQQLGEYIAAQREFSEAIRLRPDNPEGYLCLAASFMTRGDVLNAVVKLKQGLQVVPNDPSLHLAIADANIRLGKISQAIADYEIVLAVNPASSEAARGLARAFYVRSIRESTGGFVRSDEFTKARDLLNKAVAANPNNLQIRYAQAALSSLSSQFPNLEQLPQPVSVEDKAALGEAYLAQNKFKESDELLRKAFNESTDAQVVFSIADNALATSDLDVAETAYRRALAFVNSDTRGRQGLEVVARARQDGKQAFNQAQDYLQKRNFVPASEKYHDAIYGDPRNPDARLGLAQSLERLTFSLPNDNARNYREAARSYRLYISLTPSMPANVQEKFLKRVSKMDEMAAKFDGSVPAKTAADRNSTR